MIARYVCFDSVFLIVVWVLDTHHRIKVCKQPVAPVELSGLGKYFLSLRHQKRKIFCVEMMNI